MPGWDLGCCIVWSLVCGDVELVSLCVEYGCDSLDGPGRPLGRGVFSDDVERVNRNDSEAICEVHCFGDCYCDSQSGEAAWPNGDIDVVNFCRFSIETMHEFCDGVEYLGTVSHRRCEGYLCKDFPAEGKSDRAEPAGCFENENKFL